MNRLELCQTVQGILRADASQLREGPTTTIGQTGFLGEVVAFVDYAYRDIQNEQRDWLFRVKSGSFNTVAGTRAYTITSSVTDFEELLPSTAQSGDRFILGHLTATGESDEKPIFFVPYNQWGQGLFDQGTRPESRPVRCTITPNGQMAFDPIPDAVYTIGFDYRRTLHALTTDDDATTGTPIIPSRYDFAIVWRAVDWYCATRDAPRLAQRAAGELLREMTKLRIEQLPEPLFHDTI